MNIKEHVLTVKEFKKLASGRIHHTIRKEPVVIAMPEGAKMTTGEYQVFLTVTAKAKEGHLLFLDTAYGVHFPKRSGYETLVARMEADVAKEFPKSTPGGWAYA